MTKINNSPVGSTKAQLKIQQTAFMLVALVLFFGLVALVYFSISLAGLRSSAVNLQEKDALETMKTIAGTPELSFTSSSDCTNCIDLDKALQLSNTAVYNKFWNFENLEIERLSPSLAKNDCTLVNYPNCKNINIIPGTQKLPKGAFVTLAHWDARTQQYVYELGRIYATEKTK